MLENTSTFSLNFPDGATKEDRALLLASTIMLDFTYFEEKPQRNALNGGF